MVENLSLRAAAGFVEGKHRHQVCVATLAVEGAVVAGGVAYLLTAVTSLNVGCVSVSMRHRVPGQCAVSFFRLLKSQRLWWTGD